MAYPNVTPDEQRSPSMTEWPSHDCESRVNRGSFDVDAERESWIEDLARASFDDLGPKSSPEEEDVAFDADGERESWIESLVLAFIDDVAPKSAPPSEAGALSEDADVAFDVDAERESWIESLVRTSIDDIHYDPSALPQEEVDRYNADSDANSELGSWTESPAPVSIIEAKNESSSLPYDADDAEPECECDPWTESPAPVYTDGPPYESSPLAQEAYDAFDANVDAEPWTESLVPVYTDEPPYESSPLSHDVDTVLGADEDHKSWTESLAQVSSDFFEPESLSLPEIPAVFEDVGIASPEPIKFPTHASFINGIKQTKRGRSVSLRKTVSQPLVPSQSAPQKTSDDDTGYSSRRASLPVFSTVFPRVSTPRISTDAMSVRHTFNEPIETVMYEEPVAEKPSYKEEPIERSSFSMEPTERSSFSMEPFRNPAGEVQLLLLSSVPSMVRTPRRKRFTRNSIEKPWSSVPTYSEPADRYSFSATPVTPTPPDIHPERASMPEEAKTSRRKRFMRAIFGY